jgi:molybdenum cofactor cytidylyltransferase
MGRAKALLPYRGRTFIETVVGLLRPSVLDDIVVVLGHEPQVVLAGAALTDVRIVVNSHYSEGQFSSLQCGMDFLLSDPSRKPGGRRAVIVALVDQPHVPAEIPRRLVSAFEESGAPIVRPVWEGRGGHPLLLSAETFPLLRSLPRSATLYQVVKPFLTRRVDVPAPDASVVTDVDTPEDFSRLADVARPDDETKNS